MHDVWCGREGSNVCDEVGGTEDAEGRWKEEKAEEINRGEEDRQQEEAKQEEAKQKEANQNAAAMDGSPQLDGVRCWGGSTPIAESSTFWDWPQRRMKSFDTRRRRWRRRSKKHRRMMESFDTRRKRWYRSRGRFL